jgi:DNA-binding MarR family transcriptional regulator
MLYSVAPTMDPRRLVVWQRFLTAHATVVRALERELASERGLPLSWYDVLYQLSVAPDERMRMGDLAAVVLLSRAGLTRLVDKMAGAGLVCREPAAADRRGTVALLTAAGRRELRRAAPVHLRGVERHFAGRLDDADVAALEVALDKLAGSGGDG